MAEEKLSSYDGGQREEQKFERRLDEHRTECEQVARANALLQLRRNRNEHPVPADEPLPAIPTADHAADDSNPWPTEEIERKTKYKDTLSYSSNTPSPKPPKENRTDLSELPIDRATADYQLGQHYT
eukprot:4063363-Amphidinium_carterae.1